MNINNIKKRIIDLENCKIKIKINLGRNKFEYLEGSILKIHPNIFTVMTNKGIRSFSYSDIATKAVVIGKF